MRQAAVDAVISGLKRAGVTVACYLPDSLLKELYPALDAAPGLRTVRVTNEGEGAAICGGVFLSGQLGCVTPEALGLAIGLPHRRVISLDTDGGLLFNLGILATLGNEQPPNLEDKYIFVRHVEESEGIVIMGLSEHN